MREKKLANKQKALSDPNDNNNLREPANSKYGELSNRVSKMASDIHQIRQSGKLDLPITRIYSREVPNRAHTGYMSIVSIPEIPEIRRPDERSNVIGLIKAFSHLSSQFSGSGSIEENVGTFHQNYANLCRTFRITKTEAFDNLCMLFKANSEAERY